MQVLTTAIVGKVNVCMLTDGYLCIFLLLQWDTTCEELQSGPQWGVKYYVCFTCGAEEEWATALQVLHFLLKGADDFFDNFAGISGVELPSSGQTMTSLRSSLMFNSVSEMMGMREQISGDKTWA